MRKIKTTGKTATKRNGETLSIGTKAGHRDNFKKVKGCQTGPVN